MTNRNIILILFIVIVTGCKDNSVNPLSPQNQIFPLAVGNQWVMETYYDAIAQVGSLDTGAVIASTLSNGNTMYRFFGNDHFFFESEGSAEFLYYKGNDLWQSREGKDNLLVSANCAVGDSTFRADSQRVAKIMSLNDIVTVPAGKFNCIKIAYDYGPYLIRYYWLAKGIGVIKIEYAPIYLQLNPVSWQLVSYKIN